MTADPTDALKALARAQGYDLFVLPFEGDVGGMAWCGDDGVPHIEMYGVPGSPEWAHVLAHEIGHHALGHTATWTSAPTWQREYEAERYALDVLSRFCDEDVFWIQEQQAKEYVRAAIQCFLENEITQHGEIDAGVWAGCEISLDEVLADVG